MTTITIAKPIALDYGNLLRIRNGRGTRICVASGVLWVTEEDSPEDHVLLPGDAIDLARRGTAIVLAHRPARIVIEVPPGVARPRAVEMALAEGGHGRRIALASTTPIWLLAIASGIATVIRNVLASLRAPVITLSSRWGAADAGGTARSYAPMAYSDGYPPRLSPRRAIPGSR